MFDPGAISTLIIGLGEERRLPVGGYRPDGAVERAPSGRAVRSALAIVLRRFADVLEPHQPGRAGTLDRDRPASDMA